MRLTRRFGRVSSGSFMIPNIHFANIPAKRIISMANMVSMHIYFVYI
jgi:hypothetical protein